MDKRIICFNERLGDRIIIKYLAHRYKSKHPDVKLYAYQEFHKYPSTVGFDMRTWSKDLFYGYFDYKEPYTSIKEAVEKTGMKRIYPQPGNLFEYAPLEIKRSGIYPHLFLPAPYDYWLEISFIKYLHPEILNQWDKYKHNIICFHILTDAPYAQSRNHHYPTWVNMITSFAKKHPEYLCVRIGKQDSSAPPIQSNLPNILDCTDKFTYPPYSIAVISICKVYVGGDTGMTHAAAAFRRRIVGVWGDISHMSKTWNSGPYVPKDMQFVLRRNCGENKLSPIFSKEQITEGIYTLLY